MVVDPFETRKAKGSITFGYYELTELLALIDGEEDVDQELIRQARRKITKKARDIERRFERKEP